MADLDKLLGQYDGRRPDTLSQGPAPSARDKVFDVLYGYLGGTPDNRWAADKLADLATLGGFAPWAGAYEGGREITETGRPASLAMSVLPGARVAKPALQAAEQAAAKGIRAYHGSPHVFDKFDMSKIGTGEGAQSYGHGLYFAGKEDVAKQYRQDLSAGGEFGISIGGEPFDPSMAVTSASKAAAKALIDAEGRVGSARAALAGNDDALGVLDKWNKMGVRRADRGHMYEVRINASPEDFLDWDKPLSQQSEKVRKSIEGYDFDPSKTVGQTMHGEMPFSEMRSPQFSQQLRRDGIPGIRYLDQGSRSAGEGSHNYVLFRDDIVDIVRRYGIGPLLAAYYGVGTGDASAAPKTGGVP